MRFVQPVNNANKCFSDCTTHTHESATTLNPLKYSVLNIVVDRGQYGHSGWAVATQPHMLQHNLSSDNCQS